MLNRVYKSQRCAILYRTCKQPASQQEIDALKGALADTRASSNDAVAAARQEADALRGEVQAAREEHGVRVRLDCPSLRRQGGRGGNR